MAISQEQFNQKMLEDLLHIQNKAELKMLEKVAKRVAKGAKTTGWNENKLSDMQAMRKEIEKILADKDKLSKVWTSKNLMKSYDNAGKQVSVKLHQPHSAMKDIVPLRLQRLILETNNAISGTSFRILRNTMDVYREVVSESTSGVLIGTDTRLQASQQMLNDFAAKGVTGFTDKIGRKWELASYVEMATRTANSRAALQGHVDRSLELNQDLMMVSGHAATCPICEPWGNQVISITGNTPNYPTLADAQADGLFHPNCKHTLTVWFPDLEGNVEHAEQYTEKPDPEKYNAIQRQRYNERKIREAKRMEAVAITDDAKVKARNQVNKWQSIQREHVKEYNLRRKYTREGIKNRTGDPTKATVKSTIPSPILPMTKDIKSTTGQSGPSNIWTNNDGTFKELTSEQMSKISFGDWSKYHKAKDEHDALQKKQQPSISNILGANTSAASTYINVNDTKNISKNIDNVLDTQTNNWHSYRDKYNKHYDNWETKVQVSEKRAVRMYTGSAYDDMNGVLRGAYPPDKDTQKLIDKCTAALKKSKLDEDMVVRRGVSTTGFAGMFGERDIAKQSRREWAKGMGGLVGRIAKDEGFLSTSPSGSGGFTNKDIELRILLPKGTEALYVEKVSEHANEKEVLVQKGYTYEVVKAEMASSGSYANHIIYMKAIPFP